MATVSSSLMNPRSVWCSSVSIEITIPASSGLSRWWATYRGNAFGMSQGASWLTMPMP